MWQLEGSRARLQSPRLTCQLDLASPANGLTDLSVGTGSKQTFTGVDAELMRLTLPGQAARLADAYVRGNDLVATFAESTDRPCRTQVYWRFESGPEHFGIQLIVSVQTSRLDAVPSLLVTSRLPGRARALDEGAVIVSLPDTDLCYAEFADDSNIESTVVHDTQITNTLFPGSLEKGVIRRARLVGYFLPASSAEQTARTIQLRFLRSAPPLTT